MMHLKKTFFVESAHVLLFLVFHRIGEYILLHVSVPFCYNAIVSVLSFFSFSGRRANCILYGIMYSLACVTKVFTIYLYSVMLSCLRNRLQGVCLFF